MIVTSRKNMAQTLAFKERQILMQLKSCKRKSETFRHSHFITIKDGSLHIFNFLKIKKRKMKPVPPLIEDEVRKEG